MADKPTQRREPHSDPIPYVEINGYRIEGGAGDLFLSAIRCFEAGTTINWEAGDDFDTYEKQSGSFVLNAETEVNITLKPL